jgi:hypothetical protein
MLRRVALVRTDVSEELSASFIRVTHAAKKYQLVFLRGVLRLLVTASVVPSSPILVTLMETLSSSETSVLTRATRRNISGDIILRRTLSSKSASVSSWANVVPSSPILVTLMMEALSSSEMSVVTRVTRRNVREDTILHSHCRENPKSYIPSRCLLLGTATFLFSLELLRKCLWQIGKKLLQSNIN